MENVKKYEDEFFNFLIKGNRYECWKVMREFRKLNSSIMVLYEEVFKKSLYRIGLMWETGEVSVAVEHMATSITLGLMYELSPEIMGLDRKNKKLVISCVENENHQVGGKMVADIFEGKGWDTFYLGADTPMDELVKFCDEVKPDLIGLSLSIYSNLKFLIDEIATIRATTNIPIIIGGQALYNVGLEISRNLDNVAYLENLSDVENYIEHF